jgi:rubredoxin
MMICGFCGHEFDENEGKRGCGGCPGGCHSVHCPRCNYKNPLEPAFIGKLKTMLKRKTTSGTGDTENSEDKKSKTS